MRALTWQERRDVRVEDVPDPVIVDPTDAIIRVTTTAICGSGLHLYEPMAPFMEPGDILGHESMGIVEAVGDAITELSVGERVVIPFQIACGRCFMCGHGLQTQCETTQVRPRAWARHCSATPSSTGRCRGARRSICGCPTPTTRTSRCPTVRRMSVSSTSPTCYRRPGRA